MFLVECLGFSVESSGVFLSRKVVEGAWGVSRGRKVRWGIMGNE